ncbi:MAG TPA: trehalose utilization protein ThuA [Chloroflexi bacterium]|jgi:trehalose utilization protein|nr:trehalose utilization protein ThuA [Chloroflexota bacterium]
MADKIRVTVWNEYRHEKSDEEVARIYPEGIHGAIMAFLNREADIEARGATLDEPEHGLTEEVLVSTDVLIWWGHMAHAEVQDAIVDRVQQRILEGMGLIVLHSGHFSKIFRRMMGTNCSLRWREIGERERVWITLPGHPIAEGLGEYFEVPHTEMYGEYFDIPQPDELVFISWYQGGEVFRSGCAYHRGKGKVFYFAPGHETLPIYHQSEVQRVILNAVRWAKPVKGPYSHTRDANRVDPLEEVVIDA